MSHLPKMSAKVPVASPIELAPWFRFITYGVFGTAGELAWYILVRATRSVPIVRYLFLFDWRVDSRLGLGGIWKVPLVALYGQCSLWMFPVYALCMLAIVEPIYRRYLHWPALGRALCYGLLILGAEWILGWVLFYVTGYRIWYYADTGALGVMTSAYALPMFVGVGAMGERLYRVLTPTALAIQPTAPATTSIPSDPQNIS